MDGSLLTFFHSLLRYLLLITLIVRVPSTFVVAAAGAGVMWLSWWQMGLIFVALAVMLVHLHDFLLRRPRAE